MQRYQPVLELLRHKSNVDFQKAFGAKYGSEKGIDIDAFHDLLKFNLNLDVNVEDVNNLFHQIDRYSRESITSTDLNEYLEEYDKKRVSPHAGPFEPVPALYSGVRCQDIISKWLLYPEIPDIRDEVAGHYISLSRSGLLAIWTKNMKKRFETTIETVEDAGKMTTWATDLVCIPREKLLAVSTTSGDIRFFHSSTYKFEHKFSITCLPSTVLRMHCHASKHLACGDFGGWAYVIHLGDGFYARLRRRASHLARERISFDNIRREKVADIRFDDTAKKHPSPIQQVEYIPSLCAVISCSVSTKRAMLIHFLERNESLSFAIRGGVHCFGFCERLNCVTTGGVDHSLKIWNPTVNTAHNESLLGHGSPVIHIIVDEERLFLISADREKTVRVWGLLRPTCLQVLKFKETEFPGRNILASIFLDSERGRLILTTHRIAVLQTRKTRLRKKTHPDSEFIVLVAYAHVFNCIVTVGNASSVAVWDLESGHLIHEFERAHESVNFDGIPEKVDITAAGLDPSERRLITAGRDGSIKVWNFHLGLCLRVFQVKFNVLSLSFVGFHIYAAGSSKVVFDFYDNGEDTVEANVWDLRHSQSIVSLDCYGRILLASASCDGEIIVWLRKSTDAKLRMKDIKAEEDETNEVDIEYLAKSVVQQRRHCSISQILFLQKREMDSFIGNLVSCGIDGRIRFWNVVCTNKVNKCQLISKFRPIFRDCDGVLCLATDQDNRFLITGDTMGYIRVYDLQDYYSSYGCAPPSTKDPTPQQLKNFPFLKLQRLVSKKHPEKTKFPADGGAEFGFAPFLLNCFRGHLGAVMKVAYVNEKDLVITAGRGGSVRLWTLAGVYVGRLGPAGEAWGPKKAGDRPARMPPDVKAVGSALTLNVLNSGTTPHWRRALEALRRCRLGHQPEGFTEKPLRWKDKEPQMVENFPKGSSLEKELSKRLPQFPGIRACKEKFHEDIYQDIKEN